MPATYGNPFVKNFTQTTGDPDFHCYNSSGNPGKATDLGGGSATHDGILQSPRLVGNCEIVTDGTAPNITIGGNTYTSNGKLIRLHSRPAVAKEGSTPAGWFSNAGLGFDSGHVQYGRITFTARMSPGQWTKAVYGLWNVSGGWGGSTPGTGDEEDILETFWSASSGLQSVGASNLHYLPTSGDTSKNYQHPAIQLGVSDWTTWHTLQFIWLPNSLDLLIDGVEAPGYPITNSLYIPTKTMYFFAQTAQLVKPGTDRATSPSQSSYIDLGMLVVEPYTGNKTFVFPSAPQNLVQNNTGSTSEKLNWDAATPGTNPISGYNLYHRTPSGTGSYAKVNGSLITGTNTEDTGLTPSASYDWYTTAVDNAGNESADSNVVSDTMPASGVKPAASLSVTPLVVTLGTAISWDVSGSTGTITNSTLDFGDGNPQNGGQPLSWTGLASPATGTYTYETTGTFVISYNVTDGTNTDVATQTVVVQGNSQNGSFTPNLGIPLIPAAWTGFRQNFRSWWNGAMTALDTAIGALQSSGAGGVEYIAHNDTDVVESTRVAGDAFDSWVRLANGDIYIGDGSTDPTLNLPFLGADSFWNVISAAPSGQASLLAANSADSAGTASTPETIVLPTGMATGDYCVLILCYKGTAAPTTPTDTNSGVWTLLTPQVDNPTGNVSLVFYGRAVTAADNGITVSAAEPNVLWTSGYHVVQNSPGVDKIAVVSNGGTALYTHPTPNVTPAAANQYTMGVVAVRWTNAQANLPTPIPPSGPTPELADNSGSTTVTDVAICSFDTILSNTSSQNLGSASTTGIQKAFSIGATITFTNGSGSGSGAAVASMSGQMTSTGLIGLLLQGIASATEDVFQVQSSAGAVRLGVNENSVKLIGGDPANGVGVMALGEATTIPSTNPGAGFVVYVDPADHKLKCRGKSGTVTILALP